MFIWRNLDSAALTEAGRAYQAERRPELADEPRRGASPRQASPDHPAPVTLVVVGAEAPTEN